MVRNTPGHSIIIYHTDIYNKTYGVSIGRTLHKTLQKPDKDKKKMEHKKNVEGVLTKNIGIENQVIEILNGIRNQYEPNEPLEYEISPEAREHYTMIYETLYDQFGQIEKLEPFLKHWPAAILKIAMLFQPFLGGGKILSLESIQKAFEIVRHAIQSTVYLFRNDLGESETQRKCRIIQEYLAKKGGIITRHQLLGSKKLNGGTREYGEILEFLCDSGAIEIKPDKVNKKK